jgi:hypothetical protein
VDKEDEDDEDELDEDEDELVLVVLAGGGLAWVADLGTAVHLFPLSVVTNVPLLGMLGLVDMVAIFGSLVYGPCVLGDSSRKIRTKT